MNLPPGRVIGVDGCPDGWVAVAPDLDRARVYTAATLAGVIEAAQQDGPLTCVGVDIPIGLPVAGPRQADLLARERLGRRRSSLFLTPVREALVLPDYAAAVGVQRERTGQGISRQAYGLRTKVLEVDALVRAGARALLEVHPELSFATLAGAPLAHGKKTWAGAVERQRLLADAGISLDADLGPTPGRAGVDDVLDAGAAAWTARRVRDGRAASLPDPPEPLPHGLEGAIWV
jgi:predicted RNase H-like nuclease